MSASTTENSNPGEAEEEVPEPPGAGGDHDPGPSEGGSGRELMFNKDQLAYCADNTTEYDLIRAVIDGVKDPDPMIKQLMVAPYQPDEVERRMLADDGINPARLFLLNPSNVWRHTDTRSQYQRFATIRMKSIFELLDLTSQLRAMAGRHGLHCSGPVDARHGHT
jgi:hypothetical protein